VNELDCDAVGNDTLVFLAYTPKLDPLNVVTGQAGDYFVADLRMYVGGGALSRNEVHQLAFERSEVSGVEQVSAIVPSMFPCNSHNSIK
jgi:hypothetical protein